MLQPIEVKWSEELGKHVITHGERRYRAAKLAELESIPCIFHEGELSESQKIQRQLTENCLREDLTPIEQATSFKALKDLNEWNDTQLADALCLSRGLISQRLSLLSLPEPIQKKVEKGSLSEAAGYQISQVEDEEAQLAIVGQVETENLNRDEVAALVKEHKSAQGPSKTVKGTTSPDKGGRPAAITKTFKTKKASVSIKMNRKRVSDKDLLEAVEEVRTLLLERVNDKKQPKAKAA